MDGRRHKVSHGQMARDHARKVLLRAGHPRVPMAPNLLLLGHVGGVGGLALVEVHRRQAGKLRQQRLDVGRRSAGVASARWHFLVLC
jgi:hypothetical protein